MGCMILFVMDVSESFTFLFTFLNFLLLRVFLFFDIFNEIGYLEFVNLCNSFLNLDMFFAFMFRILHFNRSWFGSRLFLSFFFLINLCFQSILFLDFVIVFLFLHLFYLHLFLLWFWLRGLCNNWWWLFLFFRFFFYLLLFFILFLCLLLLLFIFFF